MVINATSLADFQRQADYCLPWNYQDTMAYTIEVLEDRHDSDIAIHCFKSSQPCDWSQLEDDILDAVVTAYAPINR